jgi:hypothetical protein
MDAPGAGALRGAEYRRAKVATLESRSVPGPADRPRRAAARVWLERLISIVLGPLAVLGLAELALAALGLGARQQNLARGFDPAARYIVPHPERPHGFRTQMFEGQTPEVDVQPKGKSTRVILFGGSNTQGFPWKNLQQFLNQRKPPDWPDFEVLNLGRRGYGSQRIRIIFEQAFEQLEPDLALFYEGHNEFIEKGLAEDVEAAWSSPLLRAAAGAAARLRLYNCLVAAFSAAPVEPGAPAAPAIGTPEQWSWDYDRFKRYTYDRTLAHLDGFRENVRAMCALADARGVPLLVPTAIGNMLAPPFASGLPADSSAADRERVQRALAGAEAALPARFAPMLARDDGFRPHSNDWLGPERGAPPGHSPPELDWLVIRGREIQAPWEPPARWSERLFGFMDVYAAFRARELSPSELAAVGASAAGAREALSIVPDHPQAHFVLGLCQWLAGQDQAAAESLRAAGRFDRAPRRASDLTNELLAEAAAGFPRARVVDTEALFRAGAPGGIIGYETMLDECHLHPEPKLALMDVLADELIALWKDARRP